MKIKMGSNLLNLKLKDVTYFHPDEKISRITNNLLLLPAETSYDLSERPWGTEIIISQNKIKDNDEKKKIYESLAKYYKNINGGRFTEFLSKFYRGEIK